MSGSAVHCPLCSSPSVTALAAVPDGDYFAGCVLESAIAGGLLWRCGDCRSMFKHPPLPAARYEQLYSHGRADQWSGAASRCDFDIVRDLIMRTAPAGSVLDVGCGTGEFLCSLPCGPDRAGIEPSVAAAAIARERGVRVPAVDLSQLPAQESFDVITLIDVIEHALDPSRLLEEALRHLKPGGLLLVSSGDPDCSAWRWFGARFWYSSFPEHLVFPSRQFFEAWGHRAGAPLLRSVPFRYHQAGVARRLAGCLMQVAFAVSPVLFSAAGRAVGVVLSAPMPRRRHFSPGIPGTFVDHHLLILRRAG